MLHDGESGWEQTARLLLALSSSAQLNAISRVPKPSDGHSTASGLATSASGGGRVEAAGGIHDEAAASADVDKAEVNRLATTGLRAVLQRIPKNLQARAMHHRL